MFLMQCLEQTNLYAAQHGKESLNVQEEEMATVIVILLMSGYCRVLQRDLYWSDSPDTHNDAVCRAMSRNRFREIFANLHLADNSDINDDRYYKVRQLFEHLNSTFKQFFTVVHYSIDESIIPYFGKHGTKQFICGKPIRFGFKLWCITSSEGFLFHSEFYCGSDTKLKETCLGHGGDVVLGLIEKCQLVEGTTVTFDNLFTSLPLWTSLLVLELVDLALSGKIVCKVLHLFPRMRRKKKNKEHTISLVIIMKIWLFRGMILL